MPETAPSRALVDVNAYAHNLAVARRLAPAHCGLIAVVKANAYGLGAVPLARRAVAEHARMLAVATVAEGAALRQAGLEAPILVLVQPARDALEAAVAMDLRLTLSDLGAAEHLSETARRASRIAKVHAMIDTGMSREGMPLGQALNTLRAISHLPHLDLEALATHFGDAEQENDSFTLGQIRAFRNLMKEAGRIGIPFEFAHAANSAAVVHYPNAAFDAIRPGLMTFGVWPVANEPAPMPLEPVLRWESRVILVKDLPQGASIGYGRTFTASAPMRAALVPVGYADGYRASLANRADVLIRGARRRVCGRVSMDQIVVDVTGAGVDTGDGVVLVGRDGDARVSVRELADLAGIVPNDLLTGLGPRVARQHIE